MRRNRQKEKTPDASGRMAAAPGVCCYLFVLVCEIEFLAVIVRIRHTFQLGKGLLGQRPHIPVHTRHGCGDLAYRPASVCVVVHTDQIFFFHGKVHHSSYLQFIFLGSSRRLFGAGGLFCFGKLLADRWPGLANTHTTALIDGVLPAYDVPESALSDYLRPDWSDACINVRTKEAYETAHEVLRGLFLGTSAAAALHAAVQVGRRPENQGKNIVVIVPDNGMKYLSTPMYRQK